MASKKPRNSDLTSYVKFVAQSTRATMIVWTGLAFLDQMIKKEVRKFTSNRVVGLDATQNSSHNLNNAQSHRGRQWSFQMCATRSLRMRRRRRNVFPREENEMPSEATSEGRITRWVITEDAEYWKVMPGWVRLLTFHLMRSRPNLSDISQCMKFRSHLQCKMGERVRVTDERLGAARRKTQRVNYPTWCENEENVLQYSR